MVLAANVRGNIIYTVRFRMDAEPYDTTRLGEQRGIQTRLHFDETIVDRESALAFVNEFFDKIEKL